MEKLLLLGDEAVAQGALDAGISGVYAYPGTPSSEITEYIQRNPEAIERNVQREWCVNEKTSMEAALGMSYAGKRTLVCMKHVGLNVAADPYVNSAMTGANGGIVVAVADELAGGNCVGECATSNLGPHAEHRHKIFRLSRPYRHLGLNISFGDFQTEQAVVHLLVEDKVGDSNLALILEDTHVHLKWLCGLGVYPDVHDLAAFLYSITHCVFPLDLLLADESS